MSLILGQSVKVDPGIDRGDTAHDFSAGSRVSSWLQRQQVQAFSWPASGALIAVAVLGVLGQVLERERLQLALWQACLPEDRVARSGDEAASGFSQPCPKAPGPPETALPFLPRFAHASVSRPVLSRVFEKCLLGTRMREASPRCRISPARSPAGSSRSNGKDVSACRTPLIAEPVSSATISLAKSPLRSRRCRPETRASTKYERSIGNEVRINGKAPSRF